VRYNTNGTPDITFDVDGVVTTDIQDNADDSPVELVVLADGKILVASNHFSSSGFKAVILRYNTNGSLDNTFDTDGKLILTVNNLSTVSDMIVQPDAKIVLAARILNDFGLIRVSSAGVPDNTFGTNGVSSPDLGTGVYSANAMAIQSDGKIVVTGNGSVTGSDDLLFVTARYNTNGSLDNTFGTAGKTETDVDAFSDDPNSITVLASGAILVTGNGFENLLGGYKYIALVQYTSGGLPDNSFDGDGKRIVSTSNNFGLFGKHIVQPDGKIVISGLFKNATGGFDFAAARFNSNGASDNTFDTDGFVSFPANNTEEFAYAPALQTDGKIVIGAYASSTTRFFLSAVRLNSNGSVDNSYDADGIATTISAGNKTGGFDEAKSVLVQPDSKIIGVGTYQASASDGVVVARYTTAGLPDNTFGDAGKFLLLLPFQFELSSAALQSDGKILVLCSYFNLFDSEDLMLIRVNANGTLDNTFGTAGRLVINLPGNGIDQALGLVIQTDGKIVMTANSTPDLNTYTRYLLRYNSNGTPDNTFGTAGFVTEPQFLAEQDSDNSRQRLVLQPDGKILLCGTADGGTNTHMGVKRYNTNGTPDASFNSGNVAVADFAGAPDNASAVTVQPDGKILVGGATSVSSNIKMAAARFNANGTLDNTFDTDGKVIVNAGNFTECNSIAVQADGKILLGGINTTTNSRYFYVARLNTNGGIDNTFGGSGTVSVDAPAAKFDRCEAMKLQTDGKILLAGSSLNALNFAVYRLLNDVSTSVPSFNSPLHKINVTPNPVQDILVLNAKDIDNGTYYLRISSIDGRILLSQSTMVSNRQLQLTVPVAGWPAGTVLVELVNKNERKTIKVLKQ
jgi:uncharacterized delta-60 repeat protein